MAPTKIAESFVAARRAAGLLAEFPGSVPENLELAYQIQDEAISLWPDAIVGWKVGQIRPSAQEQYGTDRMIGPLFKRHVHFENDGKPLPMPFFEDAFAVVEAEYIAVMRMDAPADKTQWTIEESMDMVKDLRVGLETAGSPLPALNEFGAAAVVSDFGAHCGLIVGPSITDWQSTNLDSLVCEAFIDNELVGTGGPSALQGGLARSIQVTLEMTAQRGRPLRAGDLISTGATTGVHAVATGQTARIEFSHKDVVACSVVAAQPLAD